MSDFSKYDFAPFSIQRLMRTCFEEGEGEKLCILIDLPNPEDIKDFKFLNDPSLSIQNYGHEVFYKGFRLEPSKSLTTQAVIFSPTKKWAVQTSITKTSVSILLANNSLEKDIFPNYGIILAITTWSATAPLTADAKKFGFRGATMHGLNQIIVDSGLSVDYDEISEEVELQRLALTKADAFEIDFEVEGQKTTLRLECAQQEAQKSHGLCPRGKPDVANLPAGEVYFVPTGADGKFPFKYSEETLGLLTVENGYIKSSRLLYGDYDLIKEHNDKLKEDPMTGAIGELGLVLKSFHSLDAISKTRKSAAPST